MKTIGNREIKFRAWMRKDGKMFHQNDQYLQSFLKRCVRMSSIDAPSEHEKYGDYVLTQATGLTDKKGKEVYEGDFVVDYFTEITIDLDIEDLIADGGAAKNVEIINKREEYETSVVTFENGSFVYGKDGELLSEHIKNIEVIGNVYEDQYLL